MGMIFGLGMFVFVVVKEKLQAAIFIQISDDFFNGSFESVCESSDYKVSIANLIFPLFDESLAHNSNLNLVTRAVYTVRVIVSAIPFISIQSGGSLACSLPVIIKNACILRDSRLKSNFVCHGNRRGHLQQRVILHS